MVCTCPVWCLSGVRATQAAAGAALAAAALVSPYHSESSAGDAAKSRAAATATATARKLSKSDLPSETKLTKQNLKLF